MNSSTHKLKAKLSKENVLQTLAARISCTPDSLAFLFEEASPSHVSALIIPDHRTAQPLY